MFKRVIIGTGFLTTGLLCYQYGRTRPHSSFIPPDMFPSGSTTSLPKISPPVYANDSQFHQAINKLKDILKEDQIKDSKVEIEYHTRNEFTPHEPGANDKPRVVVYPHSTEEVSQIMKILNDYKVPVVPFSGGTSLEGHFFSTRQGVVLDTSKMNKILAVNYDDLDVVVQAGVNWVKLNESLKPDNLMIGSDCGPDGLISGMINTNASGINASKYGAMISNVINLTVVLPDGTIIKTKQRPRKTSSGYSLTHLFIGSEGTLGIVTEATLKLHPIPKFETVIVGQFPSLLDSTNTVSQIYRNGIHPNAIELLDADMMHCINYSGYFSKEWDEVPTLYFKIGGLTPTMVEEQVKVLKDISLKNNCTNFIKAKDKEEAEELFSARKNAFYAILNYGKNEINEDVRLWVTDIAVPLSKLSPVLNEINTMIRKSGLQSIILAHAGDANFHCDVFYRESEKEKCEALINEMMDLGLANEGTSSGEHGIGNGKRNFLVKELGQDTVDFMRRIKLAVDPNRIMNPDKIFKIDPEDDGPY
ncbi:D-lactate dehydrogenase [cytochrome] 1, mitochondrial [[Candida] jaroonii]|uniref:D-lactate dehydrogenase [cytochrome] 1, mitochondrial n=1 Tax=[Candida] jaroonii TaxID=467808 RepID=A0ACA9YFS7_9ASCO|nr:D-lactate dehydrogenase [cytochrome] 1, mitochondrial [[Candida] jaroonii]